MNTTSSQLDAEQLLISQAREGNTQAVDVLYNRYLNLVYNYVYYQIGNKRDTEKLSEEIFIKVFDRLDKYSQKEHFLGWILKFASKEVAQYKKVKKGEELEFSEYYLNEEQEHLIKALRSLNEKSYQFVVARFFNGLTEQGTVEILGLSLDKFDDAQLQAIQAIEKLLKKDGQNG